MPKTLKFILLGFFSIVLGGIMMIVGFMHGGNRAITWQDGRFDIIRIHKVAKTEKAFKKISIDAKDANIKIVEGSHYSVKGQVNNKKGLKITNKNDKLTVKYANKDFDGMINLTAASESEYFTITVPTGTNLKNIQIGRADHYNTSNNEVDITNITADQLSLYGSDSYLNLQGVTSKDLTVSANDGNMTMMDTKITDKTDVMLQDGRIRLTNVQMTTPTIRLSDGSLMVIRSNFDTAAIQLTDGSLKGINTNWTGTNAVTTTDGDVTLQNNAVTGYQVQASDGNVHVNGESHGSSYNDSIEAPDRLNIVTSDGSVKIN